MRIDLLEEFKRAYPPRDPTVHLLWTRGCSFGAACGRKMPFNGEASRSKVNCPTCLAAEPTGEGR